MTRLRTNIEKKLLNARYKHLQPCALWETIFTFHQATFKKLLLAIELILFNLWSFAIVENNFGVHHDSTCQYSRPILTTKLSWLTKQFVSIWKSYIITWKQKTVVPRTFEWVHSKDRFLPVTSFSLLEANYYLRMAITCIPFQNANLMLTNKNVSITLNFVYSLVAEVIVWFCRLWIISCP